MRAQWFLTRFLTVMAALAVLVARAVEAAPLDRADLPAGTQWFLHVDCDAVRASEVGSALRDAWLAQPGVIGAVDKLRVATGTDPLSALRGVTVFNTSFEANTGVIVVHAKVNKQRLIRLVESFPGHSTAAHGHYEVHSWTDAKSGSRAAGAVRGDDTVVVSQSESAVGAELDLLDGKGETLASMKSAATAPFKLAGPWQAGTTVVAAAAGLASAKGPAIHSPILRQCDELSIAAGDHDGRAFVHARLLTQSPDVAAQVRSLVDGLKALGQLQSAQDPIVAKALAPMKVAADGSAVRIDWEAPSADVVKGIRERAGASGLANPAKADDDAQAPARPRP